MAPAADERERNLKLAQEQIEKQFGKGAIMTQKYRVDRPRLCYEAFFFCSRSCLASDNWYWFSSPSQM